MRTKVPAMKKISRRNGGAPVHGRVLPNDACPSCGTMMKAARGRLKLRVNGEEIAELATTDLSYQVGSGELLEGIDDVLIGAATGEARTLTTTLAAGEHAGQQAEVTAKVQAVKEREFVEAALHRCPAKWLARRGRRNHWHGNC